MKTFTKTINRLEDKNNFLIDIVIKIWFAKRYEQVLASGDQTRIALYNKIDIEKAYKLFNPAFFRSDGYIRSTIISRQAGICFPDPKFNFLAFEEFLTKYLDPDKTLYQTGDVPEEIDVDSLKSLMQGISSYPVTPKSYLTKLNNKYALLYFCDSSTYLNSEYIQLIFLKQYNLNQIKIAIYQSDDAQYPKEIGDDIEDFKFGTITILDKCLKESSIAINIYDAKVIRELLNKPVDLNYDGDAKYNGTKTFSGVY